MKYTCANECCVVDFEPAKQGGRSVVKLNGVVGTIVYWANRIGVKHSVIADRLRRGVCLYVPVRRHTKGPRKDREYRSDRLDPEAPLNVMLDLQRWCLREDPSR